MSIISALQNGADYLNREMPDPRISKEEMAHAVLAVIASYRSGHTAPDLKKAIDTYCWQIENRPSALEHPNP